jgi:hypothetical protein
MTSFEWSGAKPDAGYYKINEYGDQVGKNLQKVFELSFPGYEYWLIVDMATDTKIIHLEVTPALTGPQQTLLMLLVAEVEVE